MIQGVVNARREVILPLRLRGPAGNEIDIDAIVDTGFTSSLTLPTASIAVLGLIRQSAGRATLADGTIRPYDIYAVEVAWAGTWRPVLVSAVGGECLLRMLFLASHSLFIEAVPGGLVEVTLLP